MSDFEFLAYDYQILNSKSQSDLEIAASMISLKVMARVVTTLKDYRSRVAEVGHTKKLCVFSSVDLNKLPGGYFESCARNTCKGNFQNRFVFVPQQNFVATLASVKLKLML